MEKAFIEARVRAAGDGIRLARAQIGLALQPDGAGAPPRDAMKDASATLRDVEAALDQLGRHIDLDVAPEMRACAGCGASIRALATLCGYCWTKQ